MIRENKKLQKLLKSREVSTHHKKKKKNKKKKKQISEILTGKTDNFGWYEGSVVIELSSLLGLKICRYTAQNSVKFGAPRDTDFPQLRQPLALEVWRSLVKSIDDGSKITILTNGPLTNLANILLSESNASSIIQEVFILGGHINYKKNQEKGNVINVPSNKYAELNMFLDTLAAKTVFESSLDITLIPLHAQRKVYALPKIIKMLQAKNMTHEAVFTRRLLTRLHHLHQRHHLYRHVDMFAGEILGAVILAGDQKLLNSTFEIKHLKVYTKGQLSRDGEVIFDKKKKKEFKVLQGFNHVSCYNIFSSGLLRQKQSAVIGSFGEQKRRWSSPAA
ncbi:putative inosine/uridine-preferring nucleoside hydrolase domain, ribonucleoside hydrolase [Helianthus annuus]|nr:putative inosine/uridine-preferring nucleoside hydrolase domain, ribonucleoside hydrolase [Helianthus annuus]